MTENTGTIGYASPEQLEARSSDFDQRADIYSLGFVIFQLYYTMQTVMERHKVFENMAKCILPEKFMKDFPKLGILIKKMVDEDPDKRPSLL